MSQIIKIKRSSTTAQPENGTLAEGELAYTSASGGALFVGTPTKADNTHLDEDGDRIVTPIAKLNEIAKGVTAHGWGNHADAGYLASTLSTLDGRYGLAVDSAHQVYSNTTYATEYVSFAFPGYNNVAGRDYYIFDVYGYEDVSEAGKFVHYTVYVNVRNNAAQPKENNEISVQIVANLEADQDQTEAGNFEFKLERDLINAATNPEHKLWIVMDEGYSAMHVVAQPVYVGDFEKTLNGMFDSTSTEPTTTVDYPITYSLYGDADVKTYVASGSLGDVKSGSDSKVTAGSGGFYLGSDQIVDTNKNLTNINDVNMAGALKGPADFVIDPSGHGDNTGKVTIAGDLTVTGTTTTIDSTTVSIGDRLIRLADEIGDAAPTNLVAGLEINRGDQTYDSYILWREANTAGKKWVVSEGGPIDYALLHANNFETVITIIDGGTF